ncbi:MAG: hypothetical protein HY704_00870 [Gemmatimonadetes bacterium]|nr:hypothetical protein [Gemmatimonadota bacterium]
MRLRRWTIPGLLTPLLACYSYVPAQLDSVAPGERVRVRVSAETADWLREAIGSDNRVVEGELLGREQSEVFLDVPVATRQIGFHFEAFNQRINLAERDILEVERKALDRTRTFGFSAVLAAVGAVAVYEAFGRKAGGDTQQPPPPGPADILVPFLSIRVP